MDFKKYDDASWHYEGDYPQNLPDECAATHIGMYIAWCIDNNRMSEEIMEDYEEEIMAIKSRKITGAAFVIKAMDEKFTSDDLDEKMIGFTNDYYESDTAFEYSYFEDYCYVFDTLAKKKGVDYDTIYYIEDTWENYQLINEIITRRYLLWKKRNNQ